MIKDQFTVYEMLLDMLKGKTGHLGRTSFTPQKPSFDREAVIEQPFLRCKPEEMGISSRYLGDFLRELREKEGTDIHGIMILRKGHVIGEYSFAPYEKGMWHVEHSLCKSITGMAIGLLISEEKLSLDDKVVKILNWGSFLGAMRLKNLTVEHLLTMTSGVTFNETGIVSGDDWVRSYLDSTVSDAPGEQFSYNSMNTYILSAIVTEITGETMVEYLRPRLFEPLGIRQFFWESCPKGITKGGWGLYMCQEDVAKLGQLYLDGGRWKGQQIIPEDWVKLSTTKHVDTPEHMSRYGYGYQIWMSGREGSFNFNGMLGQNVMVYPDLDMVIVLNAASKELFQNCAQLELVQKYFEVESFAPDAPLKPDPVGEQMLARAAAGNCVTLCRRSGWQGPHVGGKKKPLGKGSRNSRTPEPKHWMEKLHGSCFEMKVQQVGILPLIMQVFHNNFTDGITKIGFLREREKNFLLLWEGEDLLKLEMGFQNWATSEISVHEESYLVAARGAFVRDEDHHLVLKLEVAFLEEAARRNLKLIFEDQENLLVCFDEKPGRELILEGLSGIMKTTSGMSFLKNLMEFGNLSVPEILMGNAISPRIPAKRCRKEENEGEQTPEGMEQIRNQEVQEDEQINENESF